MLVENPEIFVHFKSVHSRPGKFMKIVKILKGHGHFCI